MHRSDIGHVLITDFDNSRVHILDQEGQFIKYILASQQGLSKPITIDVNMEGYIWVGEYVDFYKGRVKVAKYLQLIASDVKRRVSHELNPVDLHLH